jgi:hypothetical protein
MVIKKEKHKFFSWKWFLILIVLALVVYIIWFVFFSYAECVSWDCFNSHLEKCDRVKFIGESNKMIFEYVVQGNSEGECIVGIELLQGELNNEESIKMEGQKMTCYLEEGVIMIPESKIQQCHGLLKEGLQDLMIKRLHAYLVQNLGKINLEVLDAPIE